VQPSDSPSPHPIDQLIVRLMRRPRGSLLNESQQLAWLELRQRIAVHRETVEAILGEPIWR
jgi:hypothetical protein